MVPNVYDFVPTSDILDLVDSLCSVDVCLVYLSHRSALIFRLDVYNLVNAPISTT
jgi:hypothetical protein